MQKVFLLIGVPASGKSWVVKQLGKEFQVIEHDKFIGSSRHNGEYVEAALEAAESSSKPILMEAPFSMSEIMNPLRAEGVKVEPVFIVEDKDVLSKRYASRGRGPLPKGHLTRMGTFKMRADAGNFFMGPSEKVLEYLRGKI